MAPRISRQRTNAARTLRRRPETREKASGESAKAEGAKGLAANRGLANAQARAEATAERMRVIGSRRRRVEELANKRAVSVGPARGKTLTTVELVRLRQQVEDLRDQIKESRHRIHRLGERISWLKKLLAHSRAPSIRKQIRKLEEIQAREKKDLNNLEEGLRMVLAQIRKLEG